MSDTPIDYGGYEVAGGCDYWALDRTVRRAARRYYPDDEYAWARERLAEWGETLGETVTDNAATVEAHPPELHTYDREGEVVNRVEYHPAQTDNERRTYERGVVADAFEAPPGRDSRLGLTHHLLATGLLSYADPGFACPVAMTGGVALVLDRFAADSPRPDLLAPYYEGVTAREYDDLLEGAMFLTEKQGGSDVGAAEVRAEPTGADGVYELSGEKWFCSNVDAEATLALARRPDAPDGTKGLSMFLVPHTDREGDLNDQVYRRLKDKLGTKSVPTGEVVFEGAEAYLVGEPERGFYQMTEMLTLERLHNAFASVGIVGRCLIESKIHAADREAFGETIDSYPLMRRDLAEMAVDHEAAVAYVFAAARALDRRRDAVEGTDEYRRAHRLMRALVPVAKYRTARLAVETASYACEVLGGNGYVEGFATERFLRDAQVLPIWEGTSNILSLDLLRALDREDAHEALVPHVEGVLEGVDHDALAPTVDRVRTALGDLGSALASLAVAEGRTAQYHAKELADLVFDVVAAAHLLAGAQHRLDAAGDAREALVARTFVARRFDHDGTRGITDDRTVGDDHFDVLVRYAPLDPDSL